MKDRALEKRITEMQELIDLWNQFHQMIIAVVKGGSFTEDNDRDFLNVKSTIARKFQAIADKFEKKTFPEEEITEVLSHVVSLEQLKKVSDFSTTQFENTWHRVYIALNRFLGHLENERDALARMSGFGMGVNRLLRNKLFIFLVIVGVIFGGIFAVYEKIIKPAFEVTEEGEEGEEAEERILYEKIAELVDTVREKFKAADGEEGEEGEGEEGEEPAFRYSTLRTYGAIGGILGAILCGWMAYTKKRRTILWGAFGFLSGAVIGSIILLLKN